MKGWVRRQVDQLCQHANASFTDIAIGGQPTDEFFGATGDPGVSTTAAASDHLHGMPDIEDILDDIAFFFDDVTENTPSNFWNISTASTVVGGHDDVGSLGAYGSVDLQTSNALTGSSGIMLQNQNAVDSRAIVHLWQRVLELGIRCAPGVTTADLNQCLVAVGGMTTGSGGIAFGGAVIANITDGVYFLLTTDAAGAGNWFAVAESNNVQTTVDTGVPAIISGSNVGYQAFKITYDHLTTTAVFEIDGESVATISTNIPPSTRKLAGYGVWKQNLSTGAARQLLYSLDRVLYVGKRVAT